MIKRYIVIFNFLLLGVFLLNDVLGWEGKKEVSRRDIIPADLEELTAVISLCNTNEVYHVHGSVKGVILSVRLSTNKASRDALDIVADNKGFALLNTLGVTNPAVVSLVIKPTIDNCTIWTDDWAVSSNSAPTNMPFTNECITVGVLLGHKSNSKKVNIICHESVSTNIIKYAEISSIDDIDMFFEKLVAMTRCQVYYWKLYNSYFVVSSLAQVCGLNTADQKTVSNSLPPQTNQLNNAKDASK